MRKERTICAIHTGPTTHLDHLAPLAFVMDIPLIVTEPSELASAKRLYPMVEIIYTPLSSLSLDTLSTFDLIITCGKFWAMELQAAIQLLLGKRVRIALAPHGHSDKEELLGQNSTQQDILFTYGPFGKRVLGPNTIELGNLRHWFYEKHRDHFDQLASPFFKGKEAPTVLYAPTWKSKATDTSFFDATDQIVSALQDNCHLLIKPHPLLEENDPGRFYQLIARYETAVTFILDFPPIYPLLEQTAAYLGDFSSIGYDFLTYDRPLFFLKEGGRLSLCGQPFQGKIGDPQTGYSPFRREMYAEIFGSEKSNIEKIKTQLFERAGF